MYICVPPSSILPSRTLNNNECTWYRRISSTEELPSYPISVRAYRASNFPIHIKISTYRYLNTSYPVNGGTAVPTRSITSVLDIVHRNFRNIEISKYRIPKGSIRGFTYIGSFDISKCRMSKVSIYRNIDISISIQIYRVERVSHSRPPFFFTQNTERKL